MAKISILTIGSELLAGRILNSNVQYLARELKTHNILVDQMLTCDDDIDQIGGCLDFLFKTVKYVVISGGLGPTSDDLTRDAVAKFADKKVILDPEQLKILEDLFKKRNRKFIEANRVQAMRPAGSKVIPNSIGTAPGFTCEVKQGKIIALPGVPREMKSMFEETVLADILETFKDRKKLFTATFQTFGLPESEVGTKIESLNLPSEFKIAYQASFPEVKLLLQSSNNEQIERYKESITNILGPEYIVSNDGNTLSESVHDLLCRSNFTLGLAESCTGGMLGEIFTSFSGSSKYFKGGIISYSNEVKENILGVSEKTIFQHGAVSEQAVLEMLAGTQSKLKTDFALAISGVAGPLGGTDDKPVGTLWVGIATPEYKKAFKYFYNYSREQIRKIACYKALDLLRRHLLKLELR